MNSVEKIFSGVLTLILAFVLASIPDVQVMILQSLNSVTRPLGFDMSPIIVLFIVSGVLTLLALVRGGLSSIVEGFLGFTKIFR